ncbi:MAG: HlyD family efflux transporter periplasmic adaptor subunit [Ruminococcus sp.]|nr:HlyD family efflux transporter periplasmic adaptor subunit [Ruminococcus sp.]
MKQENIRSRRIRIIAAVCAMVLIAGGSAGAIALKSKTHAQTAQIDDTEVKNTKASDDGIISAGGTITSSQLSDLLGLENTAVKLTVGEVLVDSGDTVTVGTPLYQITADSLTKAEKTLNNELQSAKSALLEQKMSYQTDKNKAYLLYESEQMLGNTAQKEYDSNMDSLDSDLKKAYDSYQEAVDTINNTPNEISAKQSELNEKQSQADSLQEKKDTIQNEVNETKERYTSAAERYNELVSEYNAAAGTVRYLGNALGKDTSDIALVNSISAKIEDQAVPADYRQPSGQDMMNEGQSFDVTKTEVKMPSFRSNAPDEDTDTDPLTSLYNSALEEYNSQKDKLKQAEAEYRDAENEYKALAQSLNECSSELKEAQNSVSSLNKEISSLNSTFSKAKSNLSKLLSEYNSLNASYSKDQLELKNKLDTDNASYENAEYHYQITISTIEEELAEVQKKYDTAEENLRIFKEELAEGYICAKQDGIVYSLNCQEGRNVNVSMPFVYYVDETSYSTVVELDQNDDTQVSIGDKVIIYSSETGMTNGKITAIAEGTSTSLADVRFNVTVEADENADLYSGQSVNVYFNYGSMRSADFTDFKGNSETEDRKSGSGSGRPDFGGGMPDGFDPSNMPDFSRRKED